MNMFKKCKVVMLPTNKKASIYAARTGGLGYYNVPKTYTINNQGRHLYILSDDKIESRDWYYNGEQILQYGNHFPSNMSLPNNCKKVIATTDKSLFDEQECPVKGSGSKVRYILPEPSQSFVQKYIKAYNKGEVIEDVLVEYEVKAWLEAYPIDR